MIHIYDRETVLTFVRKTWLQPRWLCLEIDKEKCMKATLIALSVTAAMSLGGIAQATQTLDSPVMLSDVEMDQVVAGETQPPGWCDEGFPGSMGGDDNIGTAMRPWDGEGFPGGPRAAPNQ
jgi:hypothetical protein